MARAQRQYPALLCAPNSWTGNASSARALRPMLDSRDRGYVCARVLLVPFCVILIIRCAQQIPYNGITDTARDVFLAQPQHAISENTVQGAPPRRIRLASAAATDQVSPLILEAAPPSVPIIVPTSAIRDIF